MDQREFDRVVRVFGSSGSRRAAIKTLGGLLAGAALASVGLGQAGAAGKQRSFGNSCKLDSDCVSNICLPQGRSRKLCGCASAADCPAPTAVCEQAACSAGACGAEPSSGGTCNAGVGTCNAGTCCTPAATCANDNDCGAGKSCQKGVCFTACTSACDTACADCVCSTSTDDPSNFYCHDFGFGIGDCHSNADCPTGSVCDNTISNGNFTAHLCTRPCPA